MSQQQALSREVADKVPEVLQLVLQHCPDLSTPRNICSLLLVSSACKQAVQQAHAHCSIDSTTHPPLQTAAGISSFAVWLQEHKGLVTKINLSDVKEYDPSSVLVMQNVLLLALKACAVPAPAAAAGSREHSSVLGTGGAAGCSAAGRSNYAAGPQLQLQAFDAGELASPPVLAALAVFPVRELSLALRASQRTPALCKALEAFSGLRQLRILCAGAISTDDETAKVQRLVASLARLPHMSDLEFRGLHPSHVQHLPDTLTALSITSFVHRPSTAVAAADLAHLTALQRLQAECHRRGQWQLRLPPQLTALTASGAVRVSQPHGLLQVLMRPYFVGNLNLLQDLSTQQQPWGLSLSWPHIPRFTLPTNIVDAAAALQGCTALTSLSVSVDPQTGQSAATDVPWSRYIARLTQLVELDLNVGKQLQSDLLQLSALTRLTRLHMFCVAAEGSDDVVVASLACNLASLRSLDVAIGSVVPLPVIGKLTGLRHLVLHEKFGSGVRAGVTPCILNQLLSLTQLTYLWLPLGDACPLEARQQFLSQMPLLTSITP